MSEETTQALRSLSSSSLRLNRPAKDWKQPKQLSKTTLPFGRSLNGHGRSGKEGLTGFATTLCVSHRRCGKEGLTGFAATLYVSHRRWARAGLARARMAVSAQEIANVFVGCCHASRLLVRPPCGEYAIMCEIDGEKFWFHHLPQVLDWVIEEVKKQTNNKQEESK